MSELCNTLLIAAGKTHPRTCAVCGLGPCTTKPLSNGPAPVVLTTEQKEFLLMNCDSNIELGLRSLGTLRDRDLIERMVELLEQFKGIKKAVQESM